YVSRAHSPSSSRLSVIGELRSAHRVPVVGRRPPHSGGRALRLSSMTRASLEKQPHEVAAMFDRTAERYDLVNDVLSLGMDRAWRKATAAAVDAGPGDLVLDLAAGTGTSTDAFTALGARAIACDFSLGMLRTGVARRGGSGLYGGGVRGVTFVAGDALRLPFADKVFDAVTISFGLRNVADTGQALGELLRVTKPGG